jgi:hypothetical protein
MVRYRLEKEKVTLKNNNMKNLLSFAHFFCLLIVSFGFTYYAWVSYMAFNHAAIPAIVTEIKGDVNIWVTGAVMYIIGSTAGSKAKDKVIADSQAALSASTPLAAKPSPEPNQPQP